MRLTIAPYCAAIRPAACVPAMPSACTVCSASSFKPARGAGGGREHAERRAGVPALGDMLLAHAHADARADLVAGERRDQQLAPGEIGVALGDRDQRRQHDRADVQHAGAMHVVELEALHLGAVHERGVGRGQLLAGAPDRRRARGVELPERVLEDAAPFEVGAVDARSRASRA